MIQIKSLLESSINNIIKNYASFFLAKKNVIGIGQGYKFINGFATNEPTLHVFVNKKIIETKLYSYDIIPKNFLGIKIDVIEIGDLHDSFWKPKINTNIINEASKFNYKIINTLNSKIRPIQPGCEIGIEGFSGTLGSIVFDNIDDTPYILSNNHVLSNYGKTALGSPIYQPGFSGMSSFKNKVAQLSTSIELKCIISSKDTSTFNIADAAIAKIFSYIKFNREIFNVGRITETSTVSSKDIIYKVGKKTGYTMSKIISTNSIIKKTNSEKKTYIYKNQIICSKLSEPGDSGSLVFTKSRKAIGLVMSGSEKTTTINPIEEILNYFNVHL